MQYQWLPHGRQRAWLVAGCLTVDAGGEHGETLLSGSVELQGFL